MKKLMNLGSQKITDTGGFRLKGLCHEIEFNYKTKNIGSRKIGILKVFYYYKPLLLLTHSNIIFKLLTSMFLIRIHIGSLENSCFEVLNVLFRGLKASPVAWTPFMEA